MLANVNDIFLTSLETINLFDIVTGDYKGTLDELQNVTISQAEETVDITGKQGRKLGKLKRNKGVTITGNNGMISGALIELQTGSSFATKNTEVMWADYLTVKDNKATTSYTAIGTSGSEIEKIYVKDSTGAVVSELTQAATAASGKFAYAPATKALTFSGIADNTEIVVNYKRKINASVLSNESDVYSGKCAMYIDAIGEDKCANVYRVQIYIPKADFSGEFDLEMGDDQTVQAFTAEALAGSCGAGGQLWTMTIFGANTADVA